MTIFAITIHGFQHQVCLLPLLVLLFISGVELLTIHEFKNLKVRFHVFLSLYSSHCYNSSNLTNLSTYSPQDFGIYTTNPPWWEFRSCINVPFWLYLLGMASHNFISNFFLILYLLLNFPIQFRKKNNTHTHTFWLYMCVWIFYMHFKMRKYFLEEIK